MPRKKPLKKQSPSIPDFKSFSRLELEKLLSDLFETFDNVRNFIDLRMTGNSELLVGKYKKLIKNRLIEDIEEGTDGLYEALQAVRDFAAYSPSPRDQADIMLYFVDTAVYCINDYGDLYDEFYDVAGDLYVETLNFLKTNHLLEELRIRCKNIVDESKDMGYGFYEFIGDSFYEFYFDEKPRSGKFLKKPVMKTIIKKAKPVKRSK